MIFVLMDPDFDQTAEGRIFNLVKTLFFGKSSSTWFSSLLFFTGFWKAFLIIYIIIETRRIPCRVFMGLMMFVGVLVNYTIRVNLSVNIVTMVPAINSTQNNDTNMHAKEPATLGWSPYEQGLVLGAYYWGYLVSTILSGPIIKRFGPRLVVLITTLISAILTFTSPAAAKASAIAMIVLRVVLGICGGFMLPSVQALIAHWAVTTEKGKFVACLETGTGGTVVAWALCGVIIEAWGWEWAFYFFGILAIILCVPWWFLTYDSPEEHPLISMTEKQFIHDGTPGVNKKDHKIPYAQMLTSVAVWADVIGSFGSGWGSYMIVNSGPMFIAHVLKYNVGSTGFLSSIIYLIKAIAVILWGITADFILEKKWISLRVLRKSCTVFSHIIPGCLLVVLAFNDNALIAIILFSLLMAMNAAITITTTINCQDIAPSFAGAVYGLSNGGFTVAGIFTPMVVGHFTQDDETSFEAWQPIFFTGAGICIISGLIFIVFGSTEIQKWNKTHKEEKSGRENTECQNIQNTCS